MRVKTRRMLNKTLASDIFFAVAAGVYDRGEKSKLYHEKEFFRKILDIIMKSTTQVRGLEERYYSKGR